MSSRSPEEAKAIVARIVDKLGYDMDTHFNPGHQLHVMMARQPGCADTKRAHNYKGVDCECLGPVVGVDVEQCWVLLAAMVERPDVTVPPTKSVMGIEFVRSVEGDWDDRDTAEGMK